MYNVKVDKYRKADKEVINVILPELPYFFGKLLHDGIYQYAKFQKT